MRLAWAFAFLVMLQLPPLVKQDTAKPPSHKQQTTSPQNVPKQIIVVEEHTEPQNRPSTEKSSIPDQDGFDYAFWGFWVNAVLVLATFIIAIFAVVQASAARLNAQALINAERAWITVLPYIWSPEFFPLWEDGDHVPEGPMGKHPMAHYFPAQIKNTGNTPATITGMDIRYIRTSKHPSQLTAEPEYDQLDVTERFLIKDEEMLGRGLLMPDSGTLTKVQIDDITQGKQFLYAYGIVKYSDVFDRSHETRFGYIYQIPEHYLVMKEGRVSPISFDKAVFQHGGPPAYNRFT
jgi:hypothetical protein